MIIYRLGLSSILDSGSSQIKKDGKNAWLIYYKGCDTLIFKVFFEKNRSGNHFHPSNFINIQL
ncbi:hypothetical protein AD998_21660 [bacterium 336/3]|nr:hypothetical protein AD998_21660 [bacterium 336/3]